MKARSARMTFGALLLVMTASLAVLLSAPVLADSGHVEFPSWAYVGNQNACRDFTIVSGETAHKAVTLRELRLSGPPTALDEPSECQVGSGDNSHEPVPIRLRVIAAGKEYHEAYPQLYRDGNYVTSLSLRDDGYYEGSVEPGTYDISLGAEIMGMPHDPRVRGLMVLPGRPCRATVTITRVHLLTAIPTVNGELFTRGYVSVYRNDEFIGCLVDTGDPRGFSALIYEGVYALRAEPDDPRYYPAEIQDLAIASDTSVPLVLRPKCSLRVTVTSDGKPYSEVSVVATSDDERYGLRLASQAGPFQAEVPEGTYVIEVTPHDSRLDAKRLSEVTVSLPESEVSVEIGSLGRIEVKLIGGDNIYGRARVDLVHGDTHVATLAWSKEEGLYLTEARPGTYELVVTPQSYYQSQRIGGVEVSPRAATRQTVLLSEIGAPAPPVLSIHSDSDLRDLAAAYKERYLSRLDLIGRTNVERELRRLESNDSLKMKTALDLSSAAALMEGAAGERHPAMVFAAAAAEILPDVPVVVCNFGAMLYALDHIDDSISVLFYAHDLAPDSDLILINLANGFYARGDYDQAEDFFLQALSLDRYSSLAHRGLGTIYLERGDAQKALEHFFKAAQGMYTPAIRQGYNEAKAAGGETTPSFKDAIADAKRGSDSSDGPQESSGTGSAEPGDSDAESQLIIPPLPNWPTRESFLASAKSFASFNEAVTEAVLGTAERYLKGSSSSGPDYGSDRQRALKAVKHLWQLSCFQDYYLDRITKRYDRYSEEIEAIDREWAGAVQGLARTAADMVAAALDVPPPSDVDETMLVSNPMIRPVERLEYWKAKYVEATEYLLATNSGIKEADDILHQLDEQAQATGDRGFLEWKTAVHSCYNDISMLLEEYWLYTDDIVTGTYDQELTDQLNELRRTFIYSGIFPICTDIAGRLVVFEFAPRIPTLSERGMEEVDPPRPEPTDGLDVPDRQAKECTQGTRGISVIAASAEWDCDSVTFDFTELISASAKIDFRKMEVTLFVGAGLSAKAGLGATSAGVSGKVGGYVTLDKNFDVVDVGMKSSIGAGGSVAGAGGSAGVDFTIGLATGPKGGASTAAGYSTSLGMPGD